MNTVTKEMTSYTSTLNIADKSIVHDMTNPSLLRLKPVWGLSISGRLS